jgi:aryl-alcohol dehydrogenase-like predicted oxidoreductase
MPMSWGYFGDSPDDPVRVIARAFELGVTHLDTADTPTDRAELESAPAPVAPRY